MTDLLDRACTERAVYIHIPFCHRRCPYCDFAVVDMSTAASPVEEYVDAVATEIDMAEDWEPVHAINLGGGTPSVLPATAIARLIETVSRRFGLVAGAEVSIEANPEDVTPAYAGQLRQAGVNRISLGVQSFDGEVLRSLGRAHTADDAESAVRSAQHAGMTTVSIDLIFGTPGESITSWSTTLHRALELETEHLSAYALTVERGTDLSRAVAAGSPAPDADDQADKYEALLAATSLGHYEVSNWAQPGHQCRYNLTTWAQGEYEAFGLGAHRHRSGIRSRNFRRLDAYLESVQAGRRPTQGSEQLDDWGREKERLFLGLRVRSGVELGAAGRALLATEPGQRLLQAGVITVADDTLVVARPLLTDAVAREVLALETPSPD